MKTYPLEEIMVAIKELEKKWTTYQNDKEVIFVSNETQKVEYRIPKEGPLKLLGEMPSIVSTLIDLLNEKEEQKSSTYHEYLISTMGVPCIQETSEHFFDIYFSVTLIEGAEKDERFSNFILTPDAQSVWVSFPKENQIIFDICDEGEGMGVFPFSKEESDKIIKHIKDSGILNQVDKNLYPQVNAYLGEN